LYNLNVEIFDFQSNRSKKDWNIRVKYIFNFNTFNKSLIFEFQLLQSPLMA